MFGPLLAFEQFVRTASEGLYRVSDAGEVMERAIGVRGTFYGHAIRALQGGTAAERTAKENNGDRKTTGTGYFLGSSLGLPRGRWRHGLVAWHRIPRRSPAKGKYTVSRGLGQGGFRARRAFASD